MALTGVTVRSFDVFGNKRVNIVEVAFGLNYPTGGEPLTPRLCGLNTIEFALFEVSLGYAFEYDHTNQRILVYYGDNDAASDGPLIQVPNNTNLSALSHVRGIVIGT